MLIVLFTLLRVYLIHSDSTVASSTISVCSFRLLVYIDAVHSCLDTFQTMYCLRYLLEPFSGKSSSCWAHLHVGTLLLEAERMLHVLNAPSPAATASLAIGANLADRAQRVLDLPQARPAGVG